MIRHLMIIGLSCVALFGAGARAASNSDATTRPTISELIRRMGDPDPDRREQASRAVWEQGRSAEAALRRAATDEDPEVARRARAILRDFAYGLMPDAPHEIFVLLDKYRKGDPRVRGRAARALGEQGVAGLRVLLKLREEEKDAGLRDLINQILAPREHEVAVLMYADGDAAELEQSLERSAVDSESARQDYAALLLGEGKLPQAIARWKARPTTPQTALVLTALARAGGDLTLARSAAERTGSAALLDAVLTERGEWKELAGRLADDAHGLQPVERLGFLCAYQRLSGDAAAAEKTAQLMVEHARQSHEDASTCAENLFLNDRVDEGVRVLLDAGDYLRAFDFLAARFRCEDAIDLPKRAEQTDPGHVTLLQAKTIETLQFMGRGDDARRVMREVAEQNALRKDFATWTTLAGAARQLGMAPEAERYAVAALEKPYPAAADVRALFEKLRLGDGVAAEAWWLLVRKQEQTASPADTLARLRSIFDRTIAPADLDALLEAARQYATELQGDAATRWQATVIETLQALHKPDLAEQWVKRLESDARGPGALIYAGDFRADHLDWAAAADDYARAWDQDHTSAAALFLRGWALTHFGKQQDGRAMMEKAHRLPMGSASGRHELLEALARHHLSADVDREIDLILHATPPGSWERNDALRRSAEALSARGDDLAAARAWQQAFLPNLRYNVEFVEPWANVAVPAAGHRLMSIGLIRSGKVESGLAEARLAMDETPADADALIQIVKTLDTTGHRPEADAFFARCTAPYRKLVSDYPDSGQARNQLAWAQVMCHRELDDALRNATRAVDLEPDSTASRDTLAEVYFARGDAADAALQMKRCIELEPQNARHRKQLARFEAARGPETRPATRPATAPSTPDRP